MAVSTQEHTRVRGDAGAGGPGGHLGATAALEVSRRFPFREAEGQEGGRPRSNVEVRACEARPEPEGPKGTH